MHGIWRKKEFILRKIETESHSNLHSPNISASTWYQEYSQKNLKDFHEGILHPKNYLSSNLIFWGGVKVIWPKNWPCRNQKSWVQSEKNTLFLPKIWGLKQSFFRWGSPKAENLSNIPILPCILYQKNTGIFFLIPLRNKHIWSLSRCRVKIDFSFSPDFPFLLNSWA